MLYDTIMTDIKEAMKSHDKETLSTLRFLKSAIDLFKINNGNYELLLHGNISIIQGVNNE